MKRKILTFVFAALALFACAFTLTACGETDENDGNDNGTHDHQFVNYVYNNDATCGADGTETAKCEYCEETDTHTSEAHPATGEHSYGEYTYNGDATCIEAGTESATCNDCDNVDTRPSESHPATGEHSYGEYTYNGDATCIEAGTESAICNDCDNVDTRPSAIVGDHKYEDYLCSVCHKYSPEAPITIGLEYEAITEDYEVVGYAVAGRGTSTDTEIVIPEYYNEKPVTSIKYGAFTRQDDLTSIKIPNSVTSIEYRVFSGCYSLTSITVQSGNAVYHSAENCIIETESKTLIAGCKNSVIPTDGSVTSIGNYAFYGSRLTTIEIPDCITSIGKEAFNGCGFTSLEIPNSVTSIGLAALWFCDSLTSISLPITGSFVNLFNGLAFVPSSLKTVIITGGSSIVREAFHGCSGLTSITISDSVTSIGNSAFDGCSGLTSIEIPNSVTSIGDYAFSYCSNLSRVTFIENSELKSIGQSAFNCCRSLTSINLPSGLTSIGTQAFGSCDNLDIILIPKSVTSIDSSAFYACSRLTIYCEAASQPSGWNRNWNVSNRLVIWGC